MPTPTTRVPSPTLPTEVEALRAELRCLLHHPAITPARRLAAEPFIRGCSDPTRLREWVALAVTECGRWEEQMLAGETTLAGGHNSH